MIEFRARFAVVVLRIVTRYFTNKTIKVDIVGNNYRDICGLFALPKNKATISHVAHLMLYIYQDQLKYEVLTYDGIRSIYVQN